MSVWQVAFASVICRFGISELKYTKVLSFVRIILVEVHAFADMVSVTFKNEQVFPQVITPFVYRFSETFL